MKIVVTGGAGFIGSQLCEKLLDSGRSVIVVDNFDDFYSRKRKIENLKKIKAHPQGDIVVGDIRRLQSLDELQNEEFGVIVHLAALAGVGPSLKSPSVYYDVNINGTENVLKLAKVKNAKVVFGSSSSVYGINGDTPWKEDCTNVPISPYAISKIAGENLCQSYNFNYGVVSTLLRFFTVYGPRQRPDLAIFKFIQRIHRGEEIIIFGDGTATRDYTFVEDILNGILSAISVNVAEKQTYNLGNSVPVSLNLLVDTIGKVVGKTPKIRYMEMQHGDVPHTLASIDAAKKMLNYAPVVSIEDGIKEQYKWMSKVGVV
ncbi:NAD-dependent epimerase/dehydratase family protein [Luteibaculum oceani]|uniref:NAD-dependent epimerase/dehydratase family protein n=1 Tax=Luteibaculum oceani TaxID=1294296 RepID=A0A5C6V9J2_9FLAO|nr:NAD-dependent epimerase/dehydratase family protein [Luteibaculum oceani]TXC81410.1 NAD-dependent epimerase/dehydratase family protein [Luteibaculum oceani]